MYALISLYIGFVIYLIIYIKHKNKNYLSRKITIFLAIKLIFLTVIYFAFFSSKMPKNDIAKNFENKIIKY